MEQPELDMVGVYAYADHAHARDRELWRGFLSCALPLIIAKSNDDTDKIISAAMVSELTELTLKGGSEADVGERVRYISAMLAKEIGVSSEFALASFFDGEAPTKLHKVNLRRRGKRVQEHDENTMIALWLEHLGRMQNDKKFARTIENWKSWFQNPQEKIKR